MPTKTKSDAKKKVVLKKKAVAKKPAVIKAQSPVEKIIYRFHKRFVFVPKCSNCDHVPMRINKLVALMTVLVAVLSGMVIAQVQPVDLSNLLVQAQSSIKL